MPEIRLGGVRPDQRARTGEPGLNPPRVDQFYEIAGPQKAPISAEQLAKEQAYFQKALAGRKRFVGIANLFRGVGDWFNTNVRGKEPSGEGAPGNRLSAFNQIENIPGRPIRGKRLLLGMIPDNDLAVRLPKDANYVSILQDHEAEFMHSGTHGSRQVINSEDNVGMKPEEISEGVNALRRAMLADGNAPVYLHCKSGVGRSATVLAAYFMKHEGMTLDEAINLIQQDRPDAQLRGFFGGDTKHTRALANWSGDLLPQKPSFGKRVFRRVLGESPALAVGALVGKIALGALVGVTGLPLAIGLAIVLGGLGYVGARIPTNGIARAIFPNPPLQPPNPPNRP